MGPLSSIRPVALQTETGTQSAAGHQSGTGSAISSGGRTAAVSAPELSQSVTQTASSERTAIDMSEDSYLEENTRARLEAAQRAYMAAVLAAGLNPMTNPAP